MNYSKILLSTLLVTNISLAQNVGINATGAAPVNSAALDVDMANKGVLLPRVALTTRATFAPVTGTATTSLIVYNTATAGVVPNNVSPGFYYWDGTVWQRLTNGVGNDWSLWGNTGTNVANNYLGTTDAVDFALRTNNLERMRVTSAGNVGIGTTTPAVKVAINGSGTNVYATDMWTENNVHVQGNETLTVGGRGRLRVGTAWGYVGLYSEASSGGVNNDLVLGSSSGQTRIGCDGCAQHLLVNGNLTVNPTANTFTRVISAGANSYFGVYTDALYNGTSTAPTFTYDGMTISSVGTTFGDMSYSSENTGGWHYWLIGGVRKMRLLNTNNLMLAGGTYQTTGADVAEEFTHDGTLEEGDVVIISSDANYELAKCSEAKSAQVFGVISTKPGVLLNSLNTESFDAKMEQVQPRNSKERDELWNQHLAEHKKHNLPVALNGRTPCKVVANTPIKKGDFICSSSKAGFGEKLIGKGAYFAVALEDLPSGSGLIMVVMKSGVIME